MYNGRVSNKIRLPVYYLLSQTPPHLLLLIRQKRYARKKNEEPQLLSCLGCSWVRELGAKDTIPESTCDTKSILVIGEVMLEMIPFELAVMQRKTVDY
jgi:hypothetical protein